MAFGGMRCGRFIVSDAIEVQGNRVDDDDRYHRDEVKQHGLGASAVTRASGIGLWLGWLLHDASE